MNVLDLFSGIGGFSVGFERAGMRTIGFCELEPFCREWLCQQWPGVYVHDDIRSFDGRRWAHADLICGGFPCQDISGAGAGAGLDGERSGLWFEMLRVIREAVPAWVVVENVTALRTRGADRILVGLEESGYGCWPFVVGAHHVGAPHRRQRVWIIARRMADADRDELRHVQQRMPGRRPGSIRHEGQAVPGNDGEVADADSRGCESHRLAHDSEFESASGDLADRFGGARADDLGQGEAAGRCHVEQRRSLRWPVGPGLDQHQWEAPRSITAAQCRLGVSADGLPANMGETLNKARLQAAGNAIVPAIAEAIGRVIMRIGAAP